MVETLSNITAGAGVTFDGVDLSDHAANVTTAHLPAQSPGDAGKVLQTNGNVASWQAAPGADAAAKAIKYAHFRGGL